MIKPKNKKCVVCGRDDQPWFSKKRCKSCSQKSYGKISSKPTTIKPITAKTQKKKKAQSELRNVYFEYHIDRCHHSEESGKPIGEATRANIAHLFDKGRHKSVQANLDNFIYLTLDEHNRFDELLFKHFFTSIEKEFPRSWEIACRRYKKVLPLVKERTNFYFAIKQYLDERR